MSEEMRQVVVFEESEGLRKTCWPQLHQRRQTSLRISGRAQGAMIASWRDLDALLRRPGGCEAKQYKADHR